jgi:hypothetical protein
MFGQNGRKQPELLRSVQECLRQGILPDQVEAEIPVRAVQIRKDTRQAGLLQGLPTSV